MTDLNDLLTQVRTPYVDMFEAALAELREKGHTLIIEPPMVDAEGGLAREGELNLGARYDLAMVEGEGATPSIGGNICAAPTNEISPMAASVSDPPESV